MSDHRKRSRFNDEHGWYEAVVGANVARESNLKVGDTINPTHGSADGHTHGQGFTIVGILAPTGSPHDRAVYVNLDGFYLLDGHAKPLEEGEEEEGAASAAGEVQSRPKRKWPEPLPIEQREVTALLIRTFHPAVAPGLQNVINEGGQAQAVMPILEITGLFAQIVTPIQMLFVGVTLLICIVSGVSILVSIYNSMSDRRHEIAILRSLGASRGTVMIVVLLEAIILAVGGGLIGWFSGHLLMGLVAPLMGKSS